MDLGYKITNGAIASAMSMGNNLLNETMGIGKVNGQVIEYYYNYKPGANFLLTHAAPILRASAQLAKDAALKAVDSLLNNKKSKKLEESGWRTLIREYSNKVNEKHYGMLPVNGGSDYIPALDSYGEYCPEAFIMGIKLEDGPITYEVNKRGRNGSKNQMSSKKIMGPDKDSDYGDISIPSSTDMLVWYDVLAIPQMNSDKNVILTPVQGRDYTRKEIIGNGDIKFTVTGKMCSGVPGVYPTKDVEKFVQIMKYKGLVECNHYILSILGVNKFIVTSWNLNPRQGYADNTQDYSFSAVGVMPDKETKITADSIDILDYSIQSASSEKKGRWAQMLQNKLDGLKNAGMNAASNAVNQAINKGINQLSNL